MRRAMRSRFCSSVKGMGQFTVDSSKLKEKRGLIERFRWGLTLNPHPLKIKGAAPARGRFGGRGVADRTRPAGAQPCGARANSCRVENDLRGWFICGWCDARCVFRSFGLGR